ncbi:MAG: SPFH domain-containing protein [Clostridiales bacterium]|nr:SPFH domain-containing protein [Clostridiales bacterium]
MEEKKIVSEQSVRDERENREERVIVGASGVLVLILLLLAHAGTITGFILSAIRTSTAGMITFGLLTFLFIPICYPGLKVINPNESLVLSLFGKYIGTIRQTGFHYVNPFCVGINPTAVSIMRVQAGLPAADKQSSGATDDSRVSGKKLSLKVMTLKNDKQKVNDELGNPVEIGVNVIWQISNTAKAVFNVDNYREYLSIQCDSALRNIVRSYPYDISDQGDERSLRGSSQEVADKMKQELQAKVEIAGIEVLEVRITHLAYAPEIAATMLQRQQAVAVIEARQKIVDGAVGMVEMALNKLSENNIVSLDDERKAAMVSNLLVVLCGNKDAQPIVNSGTIY